MFYEALIVACHNDVIELEAIDHMLPKGGCGYVDSHQAANAVKE